MEWETVIGLEVHVQLATKTKIFSGASTAFGAAPNTQACAIDLAMPGTLPVPNEQAFRYAVMFGLAIDAEIGKCSVFERKNYFYPDLPKGYQTTQLDAPIVGPGHVEIQLADGSTKSIRIHHAHLEEDAGKSLHEDFHGMSGIDLNRAGTPLIEIVSEPDMRSSEEAVAFARKLHSIVTSLGICDGEMSQGSMRFDVNVSVRLKGTEELGTRTETKNLNSFKFMEDAIKLEVERQIDLIEEGGEVVQETRLYNGETKTARSMRSKEEANDYRYFPCPDLLPVELDDDYIDAIRQQLPELPDARQARFVEQHGLSDYDAGMLAADAATAQFFETATEQCGDAKLAANWVMGEVSAHLNNEEKGIKDSPVTALQLAGLIARIKDNTISNKIAKQVFEAMWNGEGDADAIIEAKGLKQMSDTGELEKIVDEVIAGNPAMVEDWLASDEKKRKKKMGGFMGPIMKATKGQANPGMVNQILSKKLNDML
ncbi:Asp-tRNA(Asn)/Glu-tRNA(Gln) amidotransferase subunit GatB [Pseudomaricurvus alkylphenolicus]|uniref:Asp-tRNA(Asn)/Glu-tRNA(Gln) amidotransferase subunit GatB n=1 Tax=Pseudomaricurvus alkylphenolicus TaxID=1306991 RepID=UPI00141E37A7|nr:Asp-tRNA(Asn)/Glu-tRNA(Gln) amidotransferase subunit GatB [Pseudomaricurvus alkylphenolicus]NIB41843.1 Asp-tRNA(Asn)/Glu-tRNA(Gln) amidotransferase subunit GatB [Pseudomaricurvus alkylphenolicus]